MTVTSPRYHRHIPETSAKHHQSITETFPRHLRDISKAISKQDRDITATTPKHLGDKTETRPRQDRDILGELFSWCMRGARQPYPCKTPSLSLLGKKQLEEKTIENNQKFHRTLHSVLPQEGLSTGPAIPARWKRLLAAVDPTHRTRWLGFWGLQGLRLQGLRGIQGLGLQGLQGLEVEHLLQHILQLLHILEWPMPL